MLRLLLLSLSLVALGSAQGPSIWEPLGNHPLLTTMIRYLNQTLPCTGPCALDSLGYIVGEIARGENSATAQCVIRFINSVQSTFPSPPPPGPGPVFPDQFFTMQWLEALSRPNEICPKLDMVATCFAGASENICGKSSREEFLKVSRSLLSFLDCNVPDSQQIRVFECLVPMIFSPVEPPGFANFQQCIVGPVNYFNQGYDVVYRDITGPTFSTFERHVRTLVRCYENFVPNANPNPARCRNVVAHISRQIDSIMSWLRDGDGRSMFTCLGDLTIYADFSPQPNYYPTFSRCIETFVTNGGSLIRRVSDAIQFGPPSDVNAVLRELATDTCRTQAVPDLIECMEDVMTSNPRRRCAEAVLPTFRNAYMPTLQYIYLLGGCSSRIPGGAFRSSVCQCERAIPDYSFRSEVSPQCQMDQTRRYTISFFIINYENSPYNLQADLQQQIDAIYGGIYGDEFIASENYRFRPNGDSLEVTIDLVLEETANTNPDILVSSLPGNIRGNSGFLYEVRDAPPAPAVALSMTMIIIIVVVGVVGVLLVVALLVCCCCYDSTCRCWSQPERNEKSVVHVPASNYMCAGVQQKGMCVQQMPVQQMCVQQLGVQQMGVQQMAYGQCCQPPSRTILRIQ